MFNTLQQGRNLPWGAECVGMPAPSNIYHLRTFNRVTSLSVLLVVLVTIIHSEHCVYSKEI